MNAEKWYQDLVHHRYVQGYCEERENLLNIAG